MPSKKSIKNYAHSNKIIPLALLGGGLLMLVFAGWLWWTRLYATPERVFFGMLNNSLATSSVTREVSQEAQGNSLQQFIELNLGASNRSHIVSTLGQGSGANATKVTTESIGTTDADYTRYISIETNQTNEAGQKLDFSNLIGQWGKNEAHDTQNPVRYFNEALLGVVPFGDLSPGDREPLLNLMRERKVFETDYSSATRRSEGGRQVFVYDVTIRPDVYVSMLQLFTRAIGLESIEGLNQQQYEGVPPLQAQLTVDIVSRQLTGIRYLANGRTELYSGHGLRQGIDLPEQTVPLSELQNRLQSIR
jgi:hypothetical protein